MTRARPAFVTGCPAPRLRFTTTASLSPPAGHERQGSPSTSGASPLPTCLAAPTTGMARGLGSSSGGATLERSKLSLKQRSALGAAAAMGVFANARYQVIAGVDRYLFDHAAYLWSYLAASGAFRALR
ncbi:hypothetical protein F751_4871 [Auxenochlorella protothecoides]|uniref:Uncharacterized protein n=1 Tax=Auxenochlorella protothecoides TaxID=3075 RepID=A0A087SKX4_AUXPR|nr:hypothetical protein F751_4871 [Auxenochlorella protothecoides]KFM26378.1 hypothetical protein F751_4871 [Auxenochlorella protothecoides]